MSPMDVYFSGLVIRFIDIKKKGRLLCTRGQTSQTNQVQKLHKLRNSIKEENDWFCKANSQSTKVLKKNNLRSDMDL